MQDDGEASAANVNAGGAAAGRLVEKVLLALLLLWGLLATAERVYWHELLDRLWILVIPLRWLIWGGLAALSLASVLHLFQRRDSRTHKLTAAYLILCAAIASCFLYAGDRLGRLARFHMLRARYASAIEGVRSGGMPDVGVEYTVASEQPLRIVFPWPGGILDNWCGVVYDPSHELSKYLGVEGPSIGASAAQHMGAGAFLEMCAVESLGGDWYFCWFT